MTVRCWTKIFVFVFLFLPLLLSGCINSGFTIWSSVQPNTVKQTPDLLVIENVKVIPEKVYPDTEFTVYFTVRHTGDPSTSTAVGYFLTAYDFGVCKKVKASWNMDTASSFLKTENYPEKIQPGEIKDYSLTLKAPSPQEIANLEAKCPVRLKITYSYTAKTQIEAYVMSEERMKILQRTGKYSAYIPTEQVGIGPVKLYFEFTQSQPFVAGKNVVFFLYAKNEGDGNVESEASTPEIHVKVKVLGGSGGIIRCSGTSSGEITLHFVGEQTNKVKCTWIPELQNGDEKIFYLLATATYVYSFEKTVDVTVFPLPE